MVQNIKVFKLTYETHTGWIPVHVSNMYMFLLISINVYNIFKQIHNWLGMLLYLIHLL